MRCHTWLMTAAVVMAAAAPAAAQSDMPALTPVQIALACAPPPTIDGEPNHVRHIVGAQDTAARTVFGSHDLVVLDGGAKDGLQLGQWFFVRRANRFGMYGPGHGRGAKTLGWLHVVAINDATAIAQVDHTCGAVIAGDYLEPFIAPAVPAGFDTAETSGDPDFENLGRIVNGSEDRSTFGDGDFALIDRGTEQGVAPGQRFAIYRDLRVAGLPLASVGEAVVVSTGGSVAVARITRVRDAVIEGDYVAARKP
jgi:hypothetical protein